MNLTLNRPKTLYIELIFNKWEELNVSRYSNNKKNITIFKSFLKVDLKKKCVYIYFNGEFSNLKMER